ncbi:MAG: TraR/DksA C4-type zinc finger protein [Patescibacteria group bacterium]
MAQPTPQPTRGRLAFLGDVKNRLLKEYDRLTSRLGMIVDKGKALWDEYGSKDEENAAEVSDFQDKLSMEKNLEQSISQVQSALKHVADGTYGICQTCGKPIEAKRLELVPSATTCIDCVKKARAQA